MFAFLYIGKLNLFIQIFLSCCSVCLGFLILFFHFLTCRRAFQCSIRLYQSLLFSDNFILLFNFVSNSLFHVSQSIFSLYLFCLNGDLIQLQLSDGLVNCFRCPFPFTCSRILLVSPIVAAIHQRVRISQQGLDFLFRSLIHSIQRGDQLCLSFSHDALLLIQFSLCGLFCRFDADIHYSLHAVSLLLGQLGLGFLQGRFRCGQACLSLRYDFFRVSLCLSQVGQCLQWLGLRVADGGNGRWFVVVNTRSECCWTQCQHSNKRVHCNEFLFHK